MTDPIPHTSHLLDTAVNKKFDKVGRNDKCCCGSNKKFKQCCLSTLEQQKERYGTVLRTAYERGHTISSDAVQQIFDWLKCDCCEYKNFNLIDVTKILNVETYRPIQETHLESKFGHTIIVAERTPASDLVFSKRSTVHADMMIMFRGCYEVFPHESLKEMKSVVLKMIEEGLIKE